MTDVLNLLSSSFLVVRNVLSPINEQSNPESHLNSVFNSEGIHILERVELGVIIIMDESSPFYHYPGKGLRTIQTLLFPLLEMKYGIHMGLNVFLEAKTPDEFDLYYAEK